jgi:polysaccharide export outer membrane protein
MNALGLFSMLLVALAAIAPATAAFAADATVPASKGAADPGPGDYRIGPEDILQISVWKNDAMSKTVPVRPDGKISLPLVNDVQAAGLTPLELRDVLAKGLAEYIPNPEVSVIVNEVRSFKVSVIGEVLKPSRYELKSRATVLDALALAGGFTPFAARSRIVILRAEANGTVNRISFNYNKAISSGDGILDRHTGSGEETGNFYLRNGDVVVVP